MPKAQKQKTAVFKETSQRILEPMVKAIQRLCIQLSPLIAARMGATTILSYLHSSYRHTSPDASHLVWEIV